MTNPKHVAELLKHDCAEWLRECDVEKPVYRGINKSIDPTHKSEVLANRQPRDSSKILHSHARFIQVIQLL